jgi:hypothetical protein
MATDLAKIRDRTIVEVLYKIGFSLRDMIELVAVVYEKDGPCLNTIIKIYKTLLNSTFAYVDPIHSSRMFDPDLIKKVFQHVTSYPYESLRQIASAIGSNKDSVREILHRKLMMKRKRLKWVPHILTDEQKQSRVTIAKEMLVILNEDAKYDFKHIVTGDETWLLFQTYQDAKWVREGEESETRVRQSIGTKKQMLVIFWGVSYVPVINLLLLGDSVDTNMF